MNPLKPIAGVQTQRVQIQNGEDVVCVTIEGGDAKSTAQFLAANYLKGPTGNNSLVTGLSATPEEVLLVPSLNFSKPSKQVDPEDEDEADGDEEIPLALPAMNFAKRT